MNQIFDVYQTLRRLGLCHNQSDFSQEWLGKSRCYMSYLRRTEADPAIGAMKLLIAKLAPIVEQAREHDSKQIYRPLRSALVAARTIHDGVFELKHVPPYFRITAINLGD